MTSIPILETKRMILRAPVADDQAGFVSFLRRFTRAGRKIKKKPTPSFKK